MSTEASRTILIADDDEFLRDTLADYLHDTRHQLLFSGTAKQTWEMIQEYCPDLVLLDIHFPDSQDLRLLKRIRIRVPQTEVIVISGQTDDVSQIVDAIKLGAYDYVPKPVVREELLNRVAKALALRSLRNTEGLLLEQLQKRSCLERLVGNSRAMRNVRETIRKFADMRGCVMVRGESGTGKELAARALHFHSFRRTSPFVVVNCASIPEGLIESELFGHRRGAFTGAIASAMGKLEAAGDGTVFFDEIGDMLLPQQASLLRVLESRRFLPVGDFRERECKARFILATNRNLRELVRRGSFREDLFYRIDVAAVHMPPLRNHAEDIPDLADLFCTEFGLEMGRPPVRVCPRVLELFERHDWPGNVRELRNLIESSMMLIDDTQMELTVRDLPAELVRVDRGHVTTDGPARSREHHERERLIKALSQAQGNQSKAAELLGCHRNTVRAKIRHYGIVSVRR